MEVNRRRERKLHGFRERRHREEKAAKHPRSHGMTGKSTIGSHSRLKAAGVVQLYVWSRCVAAKGWANHTETPSRRAQAEVWRVGVA